MVTPMAPVSLLMVLKEKSDSEKEELLKIRAILFF